MDEHVCGEFPTALIRFVHNPAANFFISRFSKKEWCRNLNGSHNIFLQTSFVCHLVLQDPGAVVEVHGDVWVVRTEHLLIDCQSTPVQWCRFVEFPLGAKTKRAINGEMSSFRANSTNPAMLLLSQAAVFRLHPPSGKLLTTCTTYQLSLYT